MLEIKIDNELFEVIVDFASKEIIEVSEVIEA